MRIYSPVRPINWWSLFDSSGSVRKERGKIIQNFSVEHSLYWLYRIQTAVDTYISSFCICQFVKIFLVS